MRVLSVVSVTSFFAMGYLHSQCKKPVDRTSSYLVCRQKLKKVINRHSGSYVPLGMTLLLKKFLTGSNLTYRISSREERPRDGEKGKTAQQLFQKRDD